ncbi:MAG: L,D-transpeptidase [Chloroflexi bacterium]|nr:L,D-transpeptidase [Chloroflexota bacterium]
MAIDLYEQTVVAYEGDTPVHATVVWTGLPPNETNEGLFSVWASLPQGQDERRYRCAGCLRGRKRPLGAVLDGGISLHGTYWHDLSATARATGASI